MHVSNLIPATLSPTKLRDPRTETGKSFKPSAEWRAKWFRLFEDAHPEVARMALVAEQFAKRLAFNDKLGPKLLVLGGKNGIGKSHLAKAIVRYFRSCAIMLSVDGNWRSGEVPDGEFVEWAKIAESNPFDDIAEWRRAEGAALLVLDDVGADVDRFKTGLPTSNLARMLNARERRWTIITMNHPPATWAERFDKRVADRLHRHSQIVEAKEALSFFQAK